MRDLRTIFFDSIYFSTSTVVVLVANGLTALIVANVLGPDVFGTWVILSIIIQYSLWSNWGTQNAIGREIPVLRGMGDPESAQAIIEVAWTVGLYSIIAVAGLLFAASLLIESFHPVLKTGMRFISVLVILRQLQMFCLVVYKANAEFKFVSKIQVYQAVTLFLFSVGGVMWLGFEGFLWGQIAASLVILVVCYWFRPIPVRLNADWGTIRRVIRIGSPIWLAGTLSGFNDTLDRLFIGQFMGIAQAGYYGLTTMSKQFLSVVPQTINEVMYPRLGETHGAGEGHNMKPLVVIPYVAMAGLLPLVLGVFYFLMPWIVNLLLPDYISGVDALSIFMLSVYFLGFRGGSLLNAVGQSAKNVWAILFAAVVNVALLSVLLLFHPTIEKVAGATLLASAVFAGLQNLYVARVLSSNGGSSRELFGWIYLPFLYMCAMIVSVAYFSGSGILVHTSPEPNLFALGSYVLSMVPLALVSIRKLRSLGVRGALATNS